MVMPILGGIFILEQSQGDWNFFQKRMYNAVGERYISGLYQADLVQAFPSYL